MEKILNDYVSFIKCFENKLRNKFIFKENPYFVVGDLFERKGSFDNYNYHYHGSGCTVQKDGIICNFDVAPLNESPIKFSLWDFKEFIRTNKNYDSQNYNLNTVEVELDYLLKKGLLSWLNIDGNVFKIYQVSENIL